MILSVFPLISDFDDDDNLLELNESDETNANKQKDAASNDQSNQDRKRTSRIKVFGSTTADEKDDSFDDSFNLEDNEIVQDDDDDNSDLDSEDELELMNLTNEKNDAKKPIANNDSDNDF